MRLVPSSSPVPGMAASGASALWGLLTLSLFPSLGRADMAAGDYFVHSLPGAPADPQLKMHAGLVFLPYPSSAIH